MNVTSEVTIKGRKFDVTFYADQISICRDEDPTGHISAYVEDFTPVDLEVLDHETGNVCRLTPRFEGMVCDEIGRSMDVQAAVQDAYGEYIESMRYGAL